MKSLKLALLLFFIPILAIVTSSGIARTLDDPNCKPYEFIFARGSGQKLNDKDFRAIATALKSKIPEESLEFYELGSQENGYPAVSINIKTALGAYVSAGNSYEFGTSVEKGTYELISRVNSEAKRCKNKQFILAGYSQGALVVDKALNSLKSTRIVYVGNFGDPKLYLPEGNRACKNIGLSNYRVHVPDCNVDEGVLGGLKPYQPAGYLDKLGAWCNKTDFMCGSSLNISNILGAHTAYNNRDGYEKFAQIVSEKLAQKPSISETTARYSDSPKADVIVVFDHYALSTPQARAQYKSIDDDLKEYLVGLTNQGIRVSVYNSYGLTSPIKYFEEKIPFTNDHLDEKIDKLNYENNLVDNWIFSDSFNNNYYAVKKLSTTASWSDGAGRYIFLLGGISHNAATSFDGTTLREAIKAANDNQVHIYVLCKTTDIYYYEFIELTNATGGIYVEENYDAIKFKYDMGISNKKSPYFEKTYRINENSARTLVIINDRIYGFSENDYITITDLDENVENTIRFVSYSEDGEKIAETSFQISPKTVTTPDTGIIH